MKTKLPIIVAVLLVSIGVLGFLGFYMVIRGKENRYISENNANEAVDSKIDRVAWLIEKRYVEGMTVAQLEDAIGESSNADQGHILIWDNDPPHSEHTHDIDFTNKQGFIIELRDGRSTTRPFKIASLSMSDIKSLIDGKPQ